jgi:hypothetical protein
LSLPSTKSGRQRFSGPVDPPTACRWSPQVSPYHRRRPEDGDKVRPVYTDEMQQVCLEVRRKNRGVNGEPVLFYARRRGAESAKRKKRADPLPARNKDIPALLDGLNALGLTTASAAEVVKVTEELFPQGTNGLARADVLKVVFLHLKRQNQSGNEGR